MAGITDRPFRKLARRFGAALAVSEMLSSKPELRESRKSRLRRDHAGEPGPISVQIAGGEPAMLADAARYNVDQGAQIIDINMGCPAPRCSRTRRSWRAFCTRSARRSPCR
jgi:tRNA-dihydrouridine synthase B